MLRERGGARRVVRAVEKEGPRSFAFEPLQAPGPAHGREAARHRRLVERRDGARGRERESEVLSLVRSRQRKNGVRRRRDLHESRPDPPRLGMEGGARALGGAQRPEERRLTLSEDSGLLTRDVLERGAENVEMVGSDVRHDRDLGPKDVRRIEPASDPDFHDGHRDARAAKQLERRGREGLEVRGSPEARRRDARDDGERAVETFRRDVDVFDPDALRHGHEVRRRVEPRAHAPGREER